MGFAVTNILLSFLGGVTIGLAYFSGLWGTVRRIMVSPHPYRIMAASFVIRVVLASAAFYVIMGGVWERLFGAMAGFLLARMILIKTWGGLAITPRKGTALWKS